MMRYTSAGLVWAGPWNGPRGFGLRVAECNEGQSSCQGNTRIRTSWIVGSPSLKACNGRVARDRDASRARRDWDVLPHPLGTRTVEPATGPAPVVEEPEPWTRHAREVADASARLREDDGHSKVSVLSRRASL